jgi:hypothetical protein
MVLIEMCYCKITGKTRDLPPVHHFIPLEPYEVKRKGKKARMKSVIEITNSAKPNTKNNRREQIKLVLDMSNDGPMFKTSFICSLLLFFVFGLAEFVISITDFIRAFFPFLLTS